jgi:hypothetical protein
MNNITNLSDGRVERVGERVNDVATSFLSHAFSSPSTRTTLNLIITTTNKTVMAAWDALVNVSMTPRRRRHGGQPKQTQSGGVTSSGSSDVESDTAAPYITQAASASSAAAAAASSAVSFVFHTLSADTGGDGGDTGVNSNSSSGGVGGVGGNGGNIVAVATESTGASVGFGSLICAVITVAFGITLVCFLAFHVRLILQGKTTIEIQVSFTVFLHFLFSLLIN